MLGKMASNLWISLQMESSVQSFLLNNLAASSSSVLLLNKMIASLNSFHSTLCEWSRRAKSIDIKRHGLFTLSTGQAELTSRGDCALGVSLRNTRIRCGGAVESMECDRC